ALLRPGRVPGRLRVDRSVLAERRKGDLRSTVFDDLAPSAVALPEPEATRLLLGHGNRPCLLVVAQRAGVDRLDAVGREPVVLRSAGRHQVEPGTHLWRGCGQAIHDLHGELR